MIPRAAAVLLWAGLACAAGPDDAPLPGRPPERPETTLLDDTTSVPLIPADRKPAKGSTGWMRQSASLLFFDETASLANEIPLRTDEEQAGGRVIVREMLGGASANRRFGWTLERSTVWNASRTKALSSRRLLRVFGSAGKELWSSTEADLPETGEPLVFSDDGETLMVALHLDSGWIASVKNYLGSTLVEVGAVPRLQAMALTRNGRYAMVRWLVPEKSATHTFVEVATKKRREVPSSELNLGVARITDDGKVYSGKRLVLDFSAAK
jgi:hypothetical protein